MDAKVWWRDVDRLRLQIRVNKSAGKALADGRPRKANNRVQRGRCKAGDICCFMGWKSKVQRSLAVGILEVNIVEFGFSIHIICRD
jgi:hypothetical protein